MSIACYIYSRLDLGGISRRFFWKVYAGLARPQTAQLFGPVALHAPRALLRHRHRFIGTFWLWHNPTKPASPFISFLHLDRLDPSSLTGVQYTIAPKPGSVSKPVRVEYSLSALTARGYVGPDSLTVPVFGLYAGYANQVSVELESESGATLPLQFAIPTGDNLDPTGIYSQPDIVVPRATGSTLGFDFIFIKSALGSPVIIDTDGEVRWVASGVSNSTSSTFAGDEFIIGDPA